MKGLKSLMKSISARRLSGSSGLSSSRKRRASNMKGDHGASSATEDCSTSSAASTPPWRVERIRMGAPDEQDWWKEGDATEDDSTWLMSSSGVSESMDESIAIEGDGNSRSMAKSPSSVSTSTDGSPKKFHNCGLETWEKARAVWTAKPDNGSNSSITRNAQPVNQRELGKLLSKASSLRTYELPRRIPLTSLVESYVSVWNSDD